MKMKMKMKNFQCLSKSDRKRNREKKKAIFHSYNFTLVAQLVSFFVTWENFLSLATIINNKCMCIRFFSMRN